MISLATVSRNPDTLTEIKEQMGELSNLALHTRTENRLFDMVSITAGVCEDISQLIWAGARAKEA